MKEEKEEESSLYRLGSHAIALVGRIRRRKDLGARELPDGVSRRAVEREHVLLLDLPAAPLGKEGLLSRNVCEWIQPSIKEDAAVSRAARE